MSEAQWRRIIVLGATVGFLTLFVTVLGIGLYNVVQLLDAVGIAVLPAVQASWFYGGTIFLLKAAYRDEEATVVKPAVSEAPVASAGQAPQVA